MKIVQSCDEKAQAPKVFFKELPVGTIFKLKGFTSTFTKMADPTGKYFLVNLSINHISHGFDISEIDIVYPNARVVLE